MPIVLKGLKKITITAKAVDSKEPVELTSHTKQDIFIADSTSTAILMLWEEHIGTVAEGKSYPLQNFVVRITVYTSKKNLSQEVKSPFARQSMTLD